MKQTCTDCGKTKSLSEFRKIYNRPNRTHFKYCKVCYQKRYNKINQRASKRWLARQDKPAAAVSKAKRKINSAKHLYGVSEEDIQDLLLEQQGCCKICEVDFGVLEVSYHIDHDHHTGQVRGLLCPACNRALGIIETYTINPLKFAEYLGITQWLM